MIALPFMALASVPRDPAGLVALPPGLYQFILLLGPACMSGIAGRVWTEGVHEERARRARNATGIKLGSGQSTLWIAFLTSEQGAA